MIVFKNYFKIVFANKLFFIPFIIFLDFATYFSVSSGSQDTDPDEDKFTYAIIDNDKTPESESLLSYMEDKGTIKSINYDENAIKDALFYKDVESVLVIPENFSDDLKNGTAKVQKYKSSNEWISFYLDLKINNYLNTQKMYEEKFPEMNIEDLSKILKEDLNVDTNVEYITTKDDGETKLSFAIYMKFIGFVLLMQLLIGVTITSSAFNTDIVKKRIICSSYTDRKFNRDLLLGHCTIALVIIMFPILASFIYYPASLVLSKSGLLMILRVFFHSLTVLALAGVITSISGNQEKLTIMINAISLPLCFLGGIFIPLELISGNILKVSQFLPQYWFSRGIEVVSDTMVTSQNLTDYWRGVGIEMIMMIALMLIAIGINRQKRMLRI